MIYNEKMINVDSGSGQSIRFECTTDTPDSEKQIELLDFCLESLFIFCGDWMEPVSVIIDLHCCEPYSGGPVGVVHSGRLGFLTEDASGYFRSERTYLEEEDLFTYEKLSREDLLGRMSTAIRTGFECEEEEFFPGWHTISCTSGKFKVSDEYIENESVSAAYNRGYSWFYYPVEKDSDSNNWVTVPLDYKQELPLEVRISHSYFVVRFDVQMNWDYYFRKQHAGREHIEEAIVRMEQLGWELVGETDFKKEGTN